MIRKSIVGLAVCLCLLGLSNAWAQTIHVLDTGDPNERVCNPKSYTDLGNGIVRDNVTGLEWVKDGNLMATRNPSFDHDSDEYGGMAGDGGVTWQHALDYIALLNSEKYFGYTDWRLPSIEELSTLADAESYNPAIDPIFSTVAAGYWSSTSSTVYPGARLCVWFDDGTVMTAHSSYNEFVRAVRGGPDVPSDNFVSNANGTVTDQNTGLMWQRCSYGQTWDGNACTGDASCMEGAMAVSYVQQLNAGNYLGYRDWRLPTSNELQSLQDYSRLHPATAFPDTASWCYWSSTIYANNTDYLWFVDFENGGAWRWQKSECIFYVRAVRGGSCRADGDWCIDDSDCQEGYQCTEGSCVSIPHPGEWTWMSGSSVHDQSGVYGTKAVFDAANGPGARQDSVSWTDSAGNLWLLGGYGRDSTGNSGVLNDLWRYSPTEKKWVWVSGSNICEQFGNYGTQGVPHPDNMPGARSGSLSWIDTDGNLWLYGGNGPVLGCRGFVPYCSLNDLWRYSPATGEWTWMSGTDTPDDSGTYGTKGVPHPDNMPAARTASISWLDTDGTFWLFGGMGKISRGVFFLLNDLWRYDPASNEWTWMSGSDVSNQPGVYGTRGVPHPDNIPGARSGSIAWIDYNDNLWLFGGTGRDSTGIGGTLNDLWRYDPASNEWTWMSGSDKRNKSGVYGIKGIPHSDNVPGGHEGSISWMDDFGNLWFFGGWYNFSIEGNGYLNDLWRYDPASNEWTWVSGSNVANQTGVYGTKGTSDAASLPGARRHSACWVDSAGGFWLFGGTGYDSAGAIGYLNDLWRYELPQCMGDEECSGGYQCVEGVCEPVLVDDPPALTSGPFLAAGPWPLLPTSPESPMFLKKNRSVLWSFSDDFASCSGDCTHTAEYSVAGSNSWISLSGVSSDAAEGYAWVDLPVSQLQNGTYAFRFAVTDCAGQSTQSGTYYFKVVRPDAPPVITGGPWLAAGSWPVLPTSESGAFVLKQNYYVFWTFSDDYVSCGGLCTHPALYRKVGDTEWTALAVGTDSEGTEYAYTMLPVAGLDAGTYQFFIDVEDCAGQRTSAPRTYYFKVAAP